jgi:opine dehydrogenase
MIIAVIGAGIRGQAISGVLGLAGHTVRLHDAHGFAVESVASQGGIQVTGTVEGFAALDYAGTSLEQTLDEVDLILIAAPCGYQRAIAERLASNALPSQAIVLLPGCVGGALEFRNVLQLRGIDLPVAETDSFLYECELLKPGYTQINSIRKHFRLAVLPNNQTESILGKLLQPFPEAEIVTSVLETSLNYINPILHVAPILGNVGRIEYTQGNFELYGQGVTPSIARLMQKVDQERLAVCAALGVPYISLKGWIHSEYGVSAETLYDSIQILQHEIYKHFSAPKKIDHPLLTEGVGAGLVPLECIGNLSGLSMTLTSSLNKLASSAVKVDFYQVGRTATSMGISSLDRSALRNFVL